MENEFDFMLDTDQELTNEFLEQQLLRLPKMIYNTELFTLGLRRKVEEAKQALKDKEAELINTGVIDGKNKDARDAQLLPLTVKEREDIAKAEEAYQEALIKLGLMKNYFSTYKAISKLRYRGD